MTWTKLGDEFWDECAAGGLTDEATRTHGEAIGWVYRIERTDLHIPKHLIRRFAGSTRWESAVVELASAGFWRDCGNTYLIEHHADVIRASIAAQRRKRERDKQAQRGWRKRATEPSVSADVSDGVSAYVSAGVSGDADSQTDSQEGKVTKNETNDWPEVRQPGTPDAPWQAMAPGYDR
ncbi:MAG TPA: hypothetical protein VGJ13_19880 [Pseudonocardiaceae bacterium]